MTLVSWGAMLEGTPPPRGFTALVCREPVPPNGRLQSQTRSGKDTHTWTRVRKGSVHSHVASIRSRQFQFVSIK